MDVNWRAVVSGALAGLVVIVPLAVLQSVVTTDGEELRGGWLFVTVIGLLGSFVVAGYRAGRRAPGLPYSHGALGALGAVLLWVAISLVRDAFTSHAPKWGAIFMSALFAVSFGIAGGALSRSRSGHELRS